MSNEIGQIIRSYSQETRPLTRQQRLSFRNEIILAKIATGITVEQIQEEFQLSRAQVYNIIKQAQDEVEEWFNNFPKTGMLSLFRSNVIAVSNEIKNLTALKNEAKSLPEKLDVSKSIIDARLKFNRLVAEGPTYTRVKELVRNAESET